jgi:hypothetical protein
VDTLETWIQNSCRRIFGLIDLNPPNKLLDAEFKLLVRRISALVGPDRVRGWVDGISDELVKRLNKPVNPEGAGES